MARLRAVVAELADLALDVLAPPRCSACDEPCPSREAFCESCRQRLRPAPAERLDGVPLLSAAVYAPPVSTAIQRLKYENRPDLAGRLAKLAFEQTPLPVLLSEVEGVTLFVPVPLHPRRLAERGYNQSALVAQALARLSLCGYGPALLMRPVDTAQQASLPRTERTKNVARAFRVRGRAGRARRPIVLVDDVVTTGATARSCMAVLSAAGAELVCTVSLARTLDPAD
jgi:ComF family protein